LFARLAIDLEWSRDFPRRRRWRRRCGDRRASGTLAGTDRDSGGRHGSRLSGATGDPPSGRSRERERV